MPFNTIPVRVDNTDLNSAADVNSLMENSVYNKSSRNRVDGLLLSNSPGDTEHDITIAAGICKDSTYAYTLELTSALTKRIDASWSAGDNGGFLDTGSVAINTQYAVWLIRKDSDGTSDAVASTSFTAPTMPSGYTYKRLLRGFATDGSANIVNNQWLLTDVVNDRSANLIAQDQKSTGTDGGTATTGAWYTRVINTLVINEIPGASLSSNQIILPEGQYSIYFQSIINSSVNYFVQRVYNVSDSVVIGYSDSFYCTYGGMSTHLSGVNFFKLASTKSIELQYYVQATLSTIGLGVAANIGSALEVYSQIKIEKVG